MIEAHSVSDSIAGCRMPVAPPGPEAYGQSPSPMLLSEIQDALASAMIEMRYQPVVRLADRVTVGVEALARMNHPAWGTVMPDAFVPQIEGAGLGHQLTELVVARTFADMTGAPLAPLGLNVSLNFPLDVLLARTALTRLEAQRHAANIAVERVIIELTESQPVRDFAALRGAVEHLRSAGYQVVIDDVGPAVVGLDQLLDLPFSGIKLDKTLVLQLGSTPALITEVEHTIASAKARGLTVVAEGVEDIAVWHRLRALGVDQVQGFLVAHPLPPAAVPVWLKSWQDLPDF
jgi:EAL domain-containing protein (putative c-di-GMP-specific phosphodiesterase class I)